jgi:radical SAM superfamily enzyme YgiQ (UPF0313 family)
MRFNRVLLVSPPAASRYGGLRIPAGVGYIAQALFDGGIDYEYVDMRIGYSLRYLKKRLLAFRPDLIGFSLSSLGYKRSYQIISEVRRLLPAAAIVAGGHHVTVLKNRVLEECPEIDFGVVADGERTILDLCGADAPPAAIQGLLFRDNGRVVFTGDRPVLRNLDEIAYPRYMNFKMNDYSRQIPVHSSRGCVHLCTFCPNRMIARIYRVRSIGNFVDEIEYWYSRGIRQFAIDDDNFTFQRSRVVEFCDEIERRGMRDLFLRCSNGVRADRVDRELLQRMFEVGVKEIGFGVDGGNNRVLKLLKKGETLETIEKAVRSACEVGMDVRLFFMIGTPGETREDIEDSLRFAQKYPVTKINLNNPIPYPGTEMYDYIDKHKLFLIPPDVYLNSVAENRSVPVFETPELPAAERVGILKRCQQIEKEVIRKSVSRQLGRTVFARFLMRNLFAVGLFEKLFFNNLFFRNLFEKIRYKILIKA